MIEHVLNTSPVANLVDKLAWLGQPGCDRRLKQIVQRIVGDAHLSPAAFDALKLAVTPLARHRSAIDAGA